jgi:5-methylcytosine-specific restriction protein B
MWRTDILPLLEEHHFGDRNVDVPGRYGLPALRKSLAAKSPVAVDDEVMPVPEPGDDDADTADPY